MQYKATIALAALAAAVSAQDQSEGPNIISILNVLQTVLPSSILQAAQTNSASVLSSIESEFVAGETPSWYSAIPSDIQTYLIPTETAAASSIASEISASVAQITSMTALPTTGAPGAGAVGNSSSVAAAQSSISSGIASANSSIISQISESAGMMSSTMSGGMTSTTGGAGASSASGSGSADATSTTSDSGAVPTAVWGVGIAGAVGMVGLFAL